MNKKNLIIVFCILLLFVGCGGGNSANTNTNSGQNNNQSNNSSDPLRGQQWYLNSLGLDMIFGETVNQTYIQIVDDGFDSTHEDLKDNYDENRSWNPKLINPKNDPTSWNQYYNHGTQVAGIIGARGFNGLGIRGIAPYAKISGYAFLHEDENGTDYIPYSIPNLEKAWLSGDGANDILVSNNSWGKLVYFYTEADDVLKLGTTLLRDGKGRIYVMAGGNEREAKPSFDKQRMITGNSNLSSLANNQYVITVGSIKQNNTVSNYSSMGSNLLVTSYGDGDVNNIVTTTNNNSYSTSFNGTSASAPQVSGIIGLVLEACPDLTYRDVKYLIATTSNKIDVNNSTWIKNSANLWHSVDYGYGLIDASEMLSICKNNYTNLSMVKETNSTILDTYPDVNITFNNDGVDFNSTNISSSIAKVEWVGVTFGYLYHWRPGDLEITLTSPNGTKTKLLQTGNALDEQDPMPTVQRSEFVAMRLSSQAFYNENPNGVWKVNIADKNDNGKDGSIGSIKLQIIGH